jgi:hypothetical protein
VAIPVPDSAKPIVKSKERCKFYPACTNVSCPFHHPSLPCKVFPLCKFGDSCAYIHPRCKFDISCNRNDCNFTHTPLAAQSSPIVGKQFEIFNQLFCTDIKKYFSIGNCSCSKLQIDSNLIELNNLQILPGVHQYKLHFLASEVLQIREGLHQ